tara:strand:+ start:2004 stop:3206 length:1203 start_codon:yes stop_codon:yes gene_type:complete
MLFEIIDQKQNCKNIYIDNQICSDPNYDELSMTWAYNNALKGYNIEYGHLYSGGKPIDECCPEYLKESWSNIKKKYMCFVKSFDIAKVKATDYCFYDLVPRTFLMEYFDIRTKITDHVIKNYDRPNDYEFLLDLSSLLSDIKSKRLNIDLSKMDPDLHQYRTRKIRDKIARTSPYISYNIFGTITGRLTTKRESFPILTLDRNYRKIIKPQNDWFIELDFNAAELRCLLALNNEEQPREDIHEWHGKIINKLSDHEMDRDEIKRKIFSWLYGPANVSLGIPEIERYYNKQNAIEKYWNGAEVVNHFGRRIKADQFHALNAIIQSTTSDTFLRRAIAVNKILEGRKSFTMGLIHDSMVIDFDREDKGLLENLIKEFGNTDLGLFKVNTSLGTDFGNMRRFR